jgi:hypothetical protein
MHHESGFLINHTAFVDCNHRSCLVIAAYMRVAEHNKSRIISGWRSTNLRIIQHSYSFNCGWRSTNFTEGREARRPFCLVGPTCIDARGRRSHSRPMVLHRDVLVLVPLCASRERLLSSVCAQDPARGEGCAAAARPGQGEAGGPTGPQGTGAVCLSHRLLGCVPCHHACRCLCGHRSTFGS